MARYLISGGGTGGHIFPAVSIANALRELQADCEILFIGAEGRMEMERVPAAGYKIVGLRVEGLDRKHLFRNVRVVYNLLCSMRRARKIIAGFKPDVAVGVGGYASGAALKVAESMGIPVILQEQNSYAGVTNKMLAAKAAKICVAYEGMERFFPADKIIVTGNPVRQNLLQPVDKNMAFEYFGLQPGVPTALIMGGSLGAKTINTAVIAGLKKLTESGVQIIWQTGKGYIDEARKAFAAYECSRVKVTDFVSRMDYAYAISDVVVSRAGASSISELCLLGKAAILVPSPNVAEDHQTHNARALSDRDAALFVADADACNLLIDTLLSLLADDGRRKLLNTNILKMAYHDSALIIAKQVIEYAK